MLARYIRNWFIIYIFVMTNNINIYRIIYGSTLLKHDKVENFSKKIDFEIMLFC